MSDRGSLLADRSDMADADRMHLRALVADWTLVADLSISDLVLWVPTWNGTGFTVVAQVRPATGPTLLPHDLVGAFVPRGRRPLLDRARSECRIVAGPRLAGGTEQATPVTRGGQVIAILSGHQATSASQTGALEQAYRRSAADLLAMVAAGDFPSPEAGSLVTAPPRVGDGLIRLTPAGRVEFASPNATSAFHRLGSAVALPGTDLSALALRLARGRGPVDEDLAAVAGGRVAATATLENGEAAVTFRTLPLARDDRSVGALVLVRDVTDLRRHERALLTKEAAIREIHHRVKNNLATVAALLRLQSRRTDEPRANAALQEAVRRVGAIAVVHEALARSGDVVVPFDEVVDRIIALTADLGGDVAIVRRGSAGRLESDIATPLAMALAELLANAAQHGDGGHRVSVSMEWFGRRLRIEVADTGPGLPAGFDPATVDGLGLQIVRTLIAEELDGTVTWEPGDPRGTVAVIDLVVSDRSRPT